ncbi:hypothetical protein [Flavobacterium silvaticum]|uniref:DUF4870 domain-containing protein n=1 Tax=Flavobacterium silvaticum TaxID=1852020 RepID=A0A972JH69_9FLAO|nr:hypothetical protein [Flavobacterium silvaticum]NMH26803.1 hypothetical protein [Flavobacterium silvaticum]
MNPEEIREGKTTAITAYILIVGVLIAMSMNGETKNRFAAFHIRQAAGLSLLFISVGMIASPFGNWLISAPLYFANMILWIYGVSTAVRGEMQPVPLVGSFFQKFLKSI